MRDNIPQMPEEWDEYLFTLTKGRYGLYEFSHVVAYEIWRLDPRYRVSPNQLPAMLRKGRSKERKQIRAVIKKFEGLKKYLIKIYPKYLQLYGIEATETNHPKSEEVYHEIEEIERDCKEMLTRGLPWITKSHATDTKHKIAFIFAQVIKKENGQPDWTVIKSLLIWFWKRFKETTYRDELADSDKDPAFITKKTLSNAYSKAMKNPEKKLSIEQSATDYFSFLRSGLGQRIVFEKNCITLGALVPVDIWSRHGTVVFPDGKILNEKMERKRYFREGRSWDGRKFQLIKDGWVAFQRAARKNDSIVSSGGRRHPA
jgi:hypothetical protein